MAGQVFVNVKIPILWGKRAVIGHPSGKLSVIDLGDAKARPEIVNDLPWVQIQYSESEDGYVIFKDATAVYFYAPPRKLLRDLSGSLPECQLLNDTIRVGTSEVSGNVVSGSPVGIGISEAGFSIGGPMPAGLAELVIESSSTPRT
jgi:hypothetical protein